MFKVWIFTVSISATVMIYQEGQEDLEVCSTSSSNARVFYGRSYVEMSDLREKI